MSAHSVDGRMGVKVGLHRMGRVFPWLLVLFIALALTYSLQHKRYLSTNVSKIENLVLPDGSRYSGELRHGLMHGTGRLEWPDERHYEGVFTAGSIAGEGVYVDANGDEYRGTFVAGEMTGKGEYVGVDGSRYRGEFLRDLYHGHGEFQNTDGGQFTGVFDEGDFSGTGTFIGPKGERYEGEFEHWQYHGEGVFSDDKGSYTGSFEYGYFDGKGEYRYREDDRLVTGYWSWGKYEGEQKAANKKNLAQAIETAIYQQNALLQQTSEQLRPSDPAAINLYFVGVGGYSRQDVFRKELEFIRTQMDRDFATEGRSTLLMNHIETLAEYPLATTYSIEKTLQFVASKMIAEKDILFIYLTSHGSKDHEFSLVQQGLSLPGLTAHRFGEMVNALPIKWKVVIVSACYSGGFISELESPTTLVLTAARHDRTSFGCSDDADMTYFGRAFFEQALPTATSFEDAFATSDALIAGWEKELDEDVDHSYPQMVMGKEIESYLPRWWQGLPPKNNSLQGDKPTQAE